MPGPAVWARDAAVAGVLYLFGYLSVVNFIDHPLNMWWLLLPAAGVAGLVLAAGWKGVGDRPWFVWGAALLILVLTVTGATQS
ncbi:hypothetical protein C6N75_17990 [Streptomyces solincola]|uniref:Uncharacterized protein n=1 Tax=Streptomyces solincola TaxID=2100817 RepID=A0A2S9PU15_9ACTN|nr:hypothetical protein C6N75_17990 [Streptomyces solincola]